MKLMWLIWILHIIVVSIVMLNIINNFILINMKKHKQIDDIISVMKSNGGVATLAYLNQKVDTSNWKTKTPFASIRCYLQKKSEFFKIQPGLWALEEYRDEVLNRFQLKTSNSSSSSEIFTHSYYQGLIVQIGNWKNFNTYIPAQDMNKQFLNNKLGEISHSTEIPSFTYSNIIKRAKTIDAIWFNERNMPDSFYEVEHSTNIINSLNKFYELQDFRAKFYIVADSKRKNEFYDKIGQTIYNSIRDLVKFIDYDSISNQYTVMSNSISNNIFII